MNTKINITQKIAESAILIALATVLSYFAPFQAPMGGSITVFSQVPIILIGFRHGWKWGIGSGVVHGILQLVLQGLGNFAYVKGLSAYLILIFADYVLAFASLGLGGAMFRKMKNQTIAVGCGAFVASLLRFVCHFVSGVTIWGDYAGGWESVWVYSLGYNGFYMIFECLVSIFGLVALSLVLNLKSHNFSKHNS